MDTATTNPKREQGDVCKGWLLNVMSTLRETRQSHRSPSLSATVDNDDENTNLTGDGLELQQAVWEQLAEEHHEGMLRTVWRTLRWN